MMNASPRCATESSICAPVVNPVRGVLTAWVVARRLALSRSRLQRWRQVSTIVSAFLAVIAVLLGAGMVNVGAVVSAHTQARHPGFAKSYEDAVASVTVRGPIVPGGFSQIPVVWIQPLEGHENDPAVIPPGLDSLPDRGGAVLSPGLMSAGYKAEDFGFIGSTAGQGADGAIGDAGLASRSEGLIYVRPMDHTVDPNVDLVSGYTTQQQDGYPVETTLDVPTKNAALVGVVWLLWMPGVFLLFGAARATSPLREQRAGILYQLGISQTQIRLVAALETGVLSAIGAVPALLLWAVWLQHLQTFPLTDGRLLPGSLQLPLVVGAAITVLVVGASSAFAGTSRVLPAPQRQRARRTRTINVIPLVASLAVMFLVPTSFAWFGGTLPNEISLGALFLGAIGTFVSLPFALPVLTSWITGALGSAEHAATWMAGRTLALRKHNLARPGVMVGALVFIAGSALSIIQGVEARGGDWWPPGQDRNIWTASWNGTQDQDAQTPTNGTDEALMTVAAQKAEPVFGDDGGTTPLVFDVYFSSCEKAFQFFGADQSRLSCTTNAASTGQRYEQFEIHIGPAPAQADLSVILISGPRVWSDVEAMAVLAGKPLVSVEMQIGPSTDFRHPGIDWFSAGWAAASALLLVALLRELGDRVLLSATEKQTLVRAGLFQSEADEVYLIATLIPTLIALPIGFVGAVLFALRGYGEGITAFNLGLLSLVSLTVGVLSLAVLLAALHTPTSTDLSRRWGSMPR